MKKLFLTASVLFFAFTGNAFASYGSEACQPIYGGGQTCITTPKFILDKKVAHPTKKTKGNQDLFVDNLSVNDPKFAPGQTVKFKLSITNTGNSAIEELDVTDALPSYVDLVSGNLNFQVLNLNPDETRKYNIEVRVKGADALPSGQGVVCVVNQASVRSENDESRDNSQFCIEKAVTKGGLPIMPAPGIKQTPATGPEMLGLIGLIPAGVAGFFLRKRTSK